MADQIEEVKAEESKICACCKINAAEEVPYERVFLCRGCVSDTKTIKYDDLEHPIIPPEVESPDTRRRKEAFTAGSAELEQNLSRIDQCCTAINGKFDEVIGLLGKSRDSHVRELQALKEKLRTEIAEAEEEVRRTLELDKVQLKCKYSTLLRDYVPGTLQLFSYQIDTIDLENWVTSAMKFHYVVSSDVPAQEAHVNVRRDLSSARQFTLEADSKIEEENFAEAIKLCEDAEEIYSRSPNVIEAAKNLLTWSKALSRMERRTEAVAKYEAAQSMLFACISPQR